MSEFDQFLKKPLDALIDEMGETELLSAAGHLLYLALNESNPAAGLVLVDKLSPLLTAGPSRSKGQRDWVWEQLPKLVIAYVRKYAQQESPMHIQGVPQCPSERHVEGAAQLQRSLALIDQDREPEALQCVARACELMPFLQEKYADAVDYLRASLLQGAGVVAFNQRRSADAARHYITALPMCLRLGGTKQLMVLLESIQDVAHDHSAEATRSVLSVLSSCANAVENCVAAKGTRFLQATYQEIVSRWGSGQIPWEGLTQEEAFLIFRLAKGRRFASNLVGSPDYDWSTDAAALESLQAIDFAHAEAGGGVMSDEKDAELDTRLMGPIGADIRPDGRDVQERFRNLRSTFDSYLTRRLHGSTLSPIPRDPTRLAEIDPPGLEVPVDELQDKLDEHSVLLDFLVAGPRQEKIFAFAVTRDDVQFASLAVHDLPDASASEHEPAGVLGQAVSRLRAEIQSPAGPRRAVSRVAQHLRRPELFLGDLVDVLKFQHEQQGRRHLCVVPHRQLHFLPFHLLGADDHTLADNWVVTYLPNLHLLGREPRPTTTPRHEMVSVGIECFGANPWELPPIEGAARVATCVADLFDEKPILDEDANESEVLSAITDTRNVFIYTHGRHCVYAPWFHRMYVVPDVDNDGAISAYEILEHDLSAVDVLAASACETALGRFDLADNLTGLPASFFQAGARTVIGTLWEVHPNAAGFFFRAFFKVLAAGERKLDAFAKAQRNTRVAFPKFRDWGAFQFMGSWT